LNGFDYALIVLAAIGFWMGFRRGLVMELALLAGLIAAIFGASYVAEWIEDWLLQNTELNSAWLARFSFILALAAIYTIAWFVGKTLSTAINLMMMGLINRLAGGLFATLKYLLFIAIFLGLIAQSGIGEMAIIKESQTASALQSLGTKLFPSIKQIGQKAVTLPEISTELQ
jgi:membrane protein required for colicin V production